ncbi:MAG: malonyl-ACP O-methyltransferase BioC [Candidatus Omnitrophota bacterium]
MDKRIITRNFSRCAHTYDRYADIQKRAASELLGLIDQVDFRNILEIGCGTGNYTLLLMKKFKQAKLEAIDLSERMVEVACEKFKRGEVDFRVADAENTELRENYDLITSNACFQWFEDLRKALRKYKGSLSKEGIIAFSIFGPGTFKELNESLKSLGLSAFGNGVSFTSQEGLKSILEENFKEAQIKEALYEETFLCLKDLLRKIKYTGIRGEGFGAKMLFTPRVFERLQDCYLGKFKKIKATCQVFYCRARKG